MGLLTVGGCAANSSRVRPPQNATVTVPVLVPRSASPAGASQSAPCVQTSHGCIALNPDVSQQTIAWTICATGYTKSVRPTTRFSQAVKAKLLRQAGLDESHMSDFELDHIVPLALGGHPRNLSNLALQPWDGEHGAKRKDALEVRMHNLVCHGHVTLIAAQACIAENWEACAQKFTPRPRD